MQRTAGYLAIIVERDRVMSINFGRFAGSPLFRRRDTTELLWRGAAQLIDDRIEWRLEPLTPQ